MSVPLQPAQHNDLAVIVSLMNAAFRGTEGERGWNIETDFISGVRINESLLIEEIAAGALYLLAKDDTTGKLLGCVSLKPSSSERWYLGSLAVSPALQNSGFGRRLLESAEQYAAKHGARTIEITVVNVRNILISWYERRGYQRTGETRPFPYGDNRYGIPKRDDLEFIVLENSAVRHDSTG